MALSDFGKAVLGAAFLLMVACSGGDSFKANPNATVEPSQLPGMIRAVAAAQGLTQLRSQTLPGTGDNGISCYGRGSACTPEASPDGLAVDYTGSDGANVGIEVVIEPEPLNAKNRLQSEATALTSITVDAMQKLTNNINPGGSRPCDTKASTPESACAYQKYGAPDIGENTLAYTSDMVGGYKAASLFFTRGFLMAHVEAKAADVKAAKSLAAQLATALDEQMKQTLSQ